MGQVRVVADIGDPGGAVDNVGDVGAELLFQFLRGGDLLFERAVEQAGDDGVEVKLHRGQTGSHGQQMVDIGLAGHILLAGVTLADKFVGLADRGQIDPVEIGCG